MNPKSFNLSLETSTNLKTLKKLHAKAITQGHLKNQSLACKLLNSYSKHGKPQQAESIFTQIKNPDLISCTSLLNHFLNYNQPFKALNFFSQIITQKGKNPDGYLAAGALSACAKCRDLVSGKIIHGLVLKLGLGCGVIMGNVLIDLYCRTGKIGDARKVFGNMCVRDVSTWTSFVNGLVFCGDLDSARRIFNTMPERNVVAWNVMITGCVRNGRAVMGLEVFRRMRRVGGFGGGFAVVSVLSGCADVGALEFGRSVQGYSWKIGFGGDVIVSNAVMDMYVKCGSLELAVQVFREMGTKDVFSWTIIVSGYAFHGRGRCALDTFSAMCESGVEPNEVTFLSVLSACSHGGLIVEGQSIFQKMISDFGFRPKIEHYGCMVDLLCRAGRLDMAMQFIERMPVSPDAVICRSLLGACLVSGNIKLAEVAGRKIIELEPDDDGAYVLLWNMYCGKNMKDDALAMRKLMRERKIKKIPGCSWIEVSGTVHQYFAENVMRGSCDVLYMVLKAHMDHSELYIDSSCVEFS